MGIIICPTWETPLKPNQPEHKGMGVFLDFEVFRSPEEVKNLKFEKFEDIQVQPLQLGCLHFLVFLFTPTCGSRTVFIFWAYYMQWNFRRVGPLLRPACIFGTPFLAR